MLAPVALATALATALAGCSSNSKSSGLSGKTANEVVTLTTTAANAKGSVHLVASNTFGGQSDLSVYDVSGTQGKQTITGDTGSSLTLVVGNAAYVQGDSKFLGSSMGFPASAASGLAGRWISFQPSDQNYSEVVAGDTLSSALSEATPTGTLKLVASPNINGQAVVAISGALPADQTTGGTTGTEILYVAKAAPYLPVGAVIHETQSGQYGTSTVTFSAWGEPVNLTAPSNAVPISSLTSGG